eukprot:695443-Pyramimonas_sp.AAC.1
MGDARNESSLSKAIRTAARADRTTWMSDSLVGGNWGAVKQLRKKPQTKHAGVRDMNNKLTDAASRPDALA